MKEQIEELKRYAVRLKSGNNNLGSGVLWKPKLCQKHKLYVFTAAHVIKNHEDIRVEFERDGKTVELPADEFIISNQYQKEGEWWDVAIIPIDYNYQELPRYRVAELSYDLNKILKNPQLIMVGFPQEGYIDKSFRLSMDTLECEYEDVDKSIETIKYKFVVPNIDNSDKNLELGGFSGAGIFAQIDSEIVLLGIHKGALGENAARGNLLGATADFIRKMCHENNCDTPEKPGEVNGNLLDRKQFFIDEILSDLEEDDYEKVSILLGDILKQDMVEMISSAFCNYCEECEYKTNYHRCIYFRGFLLILAVFLKIVDEDTNLLSPRIGKMNEIPIYFVCSEGKGVANKDQQTQLKLSHFIYALKLERDLSYKLEDGCIIVWGSERTPRDNQRKCGYSEYKNMLRDITHIPGNGLDITCVFSEPKPTVIIHINEIINMLREGKLNQLKENFDKYIEELGK